MDQVLQEAYLTLTWVGLVAMTGGLGVVLITILVASSAPGLQLKRLAFFLFALALFLLWLNG